jgi:hypothetical protein
MLANQIEQDLAVDLARCGSCGADEAVGVDLSHSEVRGRERKSGLPPGRAKGRGQERPLVRSSGGLEPSLPLVEP